jgi:hypothetical protein
MYKASSGNPVSNATPYAFNELLLPYKPASLYSSSSRPRFPAVPVMAGVAGTGLGNGQQK